MTDDVDRRKNIRVVFNVSADVTESGSQGRKIHCEDTRDISLKGAYLLTNEPFPDGTECAIDLLLEGSSSKLTLHIKGKVVRSDNDGMAVNFTDMDVDSLIHLKNILYYNSGDPDRIDAELAGPRLSVSKPESYFFNKIQRN